MSNNNVFFGPPTFCNDFDKHPVQDPTKILHFTSNDSLSTANLSRYGGQKLSPGYTCPSSI